MTFHAAFVPAFEGPDEPYHLARALAFAEKPFAQALRGAPVEPSLVEAVRGKPCAENLHRVFGCPLFGSELARFDVLAPDRPVRRLVRSRIRRTTSRPWPICWRVWR